MSEIRVTTISDTAGTGPVTLTKQHAAKAWFSSYTEGTASNSFGISSATDNGTGDATYTFTNSFSNQNYSAPSSARWRRSEYHLDNTSSNIRYYTTEPSASESSLVGYASTSGLTAAYFGDLA